MDINFNKCFVVIKNLTTIRDSSGFDTSFDIYEHVAYR